MMYDTHYEERGPYPGIAGRRMGPGPGARLTPCFQASKPPWSCGRAAPEKGSWPRLGSRDPQASWPLGVEMRYPIAIEPGTDTTAFGVVVPDLPGCFSAGDTLDEAVAGAEEAAAAWVDAALDAGQAIPPPTSLEALRRNPDFAGWTFGVISLDPAELDDTTERVNITLPRRVLRRLDALARAAGESRSGYIALLTLEEPRREA